VIYKIKNAINNNYDYLELQSEEFATAKLVENRDAYLKQEESRFSVAKITVVGNDTTLENADLDNDPEGAEYQVFNQYTGQHEILPSLSLAKARKQEIINRFITESDLDAWAIVAKIPDPTHFVEPVTTIKSF
jgi:hypothetical protein